MRNFGPNDENNGTLAQMFRNAGINDVNTYVTEIRQQNMNIDESSMDDDYNSRDNPQIRSGGSHKMGGFLNNAEKLVDKNKNGKNPMNNMKKMYQLVRPQ